MADETSTGKDAQSSSADETSGGQGAQAGSAGEHSGGQGAQAGSAGEHSGGQGAQAGGAGEHSGGQGAQAGSADQTSGGQGAVSSFRKQSPESFEMWFGKHLNKIGVVFLVLGLALLIVNEFQYFTPLMKIITGLISGVSLIGCGVWFEKKSEFPLYGYVLSAGGWALTYFTTFAAYHFTDVRVIHSSVLDLILLMGISWGAVLHFLRLKSELITGISLTLAFVTTCLSSVSIFTLVSCAVIVGSLVFIVRNMRWYWLFITGVVAFYGLYLCLLLPHVVVDPSLHMLGLTDGQCRFWLTAGFSTLFWVAFNGALMSLDESTHLRRNLLLLATTINGIAYLGAVLAAMDGVYPENRFAFLLSMALAYGLSVSQGLKRCMPATADVHTLFCLFCVTLAVPLKLTGDWISASWLLEIPLLIWIAKRNDMPVVKWFAMALSVISFGKLITYDMYTGHLASTFLSPVETGLIDSFVGIAAAMLAFASHRFSRDAEADIKSSRYYFTVALIVAFFAIFKFGLLSWTPLMLLGLYGATAAYGLKLRDRYIRVLGDVGIVFSYLWVFCVPEWSSFALLLSIIVLLLVEQAYLRSEPSKVFDGVRVGLSAGAVVLFGMLVNRVCDSHLLLIGWTAGALALLAQGFAFRQTAHNHATYRQAALGVMCLVSFFQIAFNLANQQVFGASQSVPMTLGALPLYWRHIDALVIVSALAVIAYVYRMPRSQEIEGSGWRGYYLMYALAAYGIVQRCVNMEIVPEWQPLFYTIASLVPFFIGMITKDRELRVISAASGAMLSALQLRATFTQAQWSILPTLMLAGLWYGLSFSYRNMKAEIRSYLETDVEHVFAIAATIVVTLLVMAHADKWLTLLWAMEAFALLVVGFQIKDKVFRVCGLILFSLVSAKLLFIDLAALQSVYRILSFIAAGLALLATSYGYTRFQARSREVH